MGISDLHGQMDENVKETDGFVSTPVPEGIYKVVIVNIENIDKEWGIGLSIQFQIIDGEYSGRKIFNWINIIHTKPTVQAMAQGQLRKIRDPTHFRSDDISCDTLASTIEI